MSAVGAACGTWPSPVSAARVAAGSKPLSSLRIDGARIHWLQGLPDEGGRVAAMVWAPGASQPRLRTATPFNVRTRVHEYGEGAYTVAGETLYFSNFADNLVYRRTPMVWRGRSPTTARSATPTSSTTSRDSD